MAQELQQVPVLFSDDGRQVVMLSSHCGYYLGKSSDLQLTVAALGNDLGSTPSGQLQQVGFGQQPATVDQLSASSPAASQRSSDAQVSLTTPAQHPQADPFALETSLASDMTAI